MKKTGIIVFCIAGALLFHAESFAEILLESPKVGSVVPLVSDNQKKLRSFGTSAEREAAIEADAKEKKFYYAKTAYWRKQMPVVFTWKCTGVEAPPFRVTISEKPDFSDAIHLFTDNDGKLAADPEDTKFELGRKYYWKVTSYGKKGEKKWRKKLVGVSEPSSFETEDVVPRWISIKGGVGNIRDLGGYRTMDGRRVKQNLIFRGQGLNYNSVNGENPGRNRLMVVDLEYFLNCVKIRTDLDLRSDFETAKMKVSPLGESVQYIQRGSYCYQQIFTEKGKLSMAENFRVFCDAKNYPIYFHCIAGADRTGSLAFVLEAVLGVPEKEVEMDYERTFYPRHRNGIFWERCRILRDGLMQFGKEGDPLQKRAELYLKACGITQEEIENFRAIMLE